MGEAIGGSRYIHTFEALESNVRLYSRSFSTFFSRARGSIMLTDDGRTVIDALLASLYMRRFVLGWKKLGLERSLGTRHFLSGAGALNYGHNNHQIKAAITEYLASDAVIHGLGMATPVKLQFMEIFNSVILRERGLRYRFHFTWPTGANAIEAALKLSRKVIGRENIIGALF
ncbi:hypothetical protein NKH14_31555 [Mesorhizobium sp. M1380]|uniref:hypothetical protein n=1 Tax=Mesorhizobium sp. M1380 TaxID=2957093 RepID=UPI00333903FE